MAGCYRASLTVPFILIFLLPESLLNSTIITDNEFYHINLRKFLEPAVGNDSEWLLCFRASIHGFDVDPDFHSRCDGKNNTVIIIQANQKYVFGGYTDIPWGKYMLMLLLFLFSGGSFKGKSSLSREFSRPNVRCWKNVIGAVLSQVKS